MPITRLNFFSAKPGQAEGLSEFLNGIIAIVGAADGCRSVQLLRDQRAPDDFVILESWESVAAHQHAATLIPRERIAAVMPYLAAPPRGEYLTALA